MVVIIEDSKENSLSWSLSHKTCQDRNRSIFHPRQLWLRSKRGMSGFNSRIDWTNSRGYGNNQVDKGGLPPLGKAELIRAILDTAAGSLNPEAKGFDKTVRDLFPILNEWNPHARMGSPLTWTTPISCTGTGSFDSAGVIIKGTGSAGGFCSTGKVIYFPVSKWSRMTKRRKIWRKQPAWETKLLKTASNALKRITSPFRIRQLMNINRNTMIDICTPVIYKQAAAYHIW